MTHIPYLPLSRICTPPAPSACAGPAQHGDAMLASSGDTFLSPLISLSYVDSYREPNGNCCGRPEPLSREHTTCSNSSWVSTGDKLR